MYTKHLCCIAKPANVVQVISHNRLNNVWSCNHRFFRAICFFGGFRIIDGIPVSSMSTPREGADMGDSHISGVEGNVTHRVAAEIMVSQANGGGAAGDRWHASLANRPIVSPFLAMFWKMFDPELQQGILFVLLDREVLHPIGIIRYLDTLDESETTLTWKSNGVFGMHKRKPY